MSLYPLDNHCVLRKLLTAVSRQDTSLGCPLPAHQLTMHCLSFSKPCIKPSSYSISQADPPPQSATPPPRNIICVAAKGKGGRRRIKNVFVDDHGYPDQTDDHDTLLHNIEKGPVLRKLRHPPLPLGEVDPSFDFPFNEVLHGARLHQLQLSRPSSTAL